MDFNNILGKVKNNKVLAIATIIAVPTVLVAGYYGYTYIRKKQKEKQEQDFIMRMRNKYENINNIDEFLEGVKYVEQPVQFGYDLKYLSKKRDKLEALGFEKVKELYENLKIPMYKKSEEENQRLLDLLNLID